MSGVRPIAMDHFYRRLHERGLTTTALAQEVGRSRVVVTRVLNGSRRRGPVWARIKALLRPEELELLDVVQCDTWNARRLAQRPRWADVRAQLEGKRRDELDAA